MSCDHVGSLIIRDYSPKDGPIFRPDCALLATSSGQEKLSLVYNLNQMEITKNSQASYEIPP